jgi:3D (Asp-Asp-Asp) domain-containing protein
MVNDNVNNNIFITQYHLQELLYENVWGSIYSAENSQCDSTPTITADGSEIDINHASKLRWIAVSQDILNDKCRAKLYPNDNHFKGKIQFGDTIWIVSPYKNINGWWVVHDTKNSRMNNSIDFLQTMGDGNLYNHSKQWSGKFKHIKIYRSRIKSCNFI